MGPPALLPQHVRIPFINKLYGSKAPSIPQRANESAQVSPFQIHFLSSAVTGRLLMNSVRRAMKKQFVRIFFLPPQIWWNSIVSEDVGKSRACSGLFYLVNHKPTESWRLSQILGFILILCNIFVTSHSIYFWAGGRRSFLYATHQWQCRCAARCCVVFNMTHNNRIGPSPAFWAGVKRKNKADNDTEAQSAGSAWLALCRAWAQV